MTSSSSNLPPNARLSQNAFITSKVNRLRDRTISSSVVRTITAELARILAVEATQNDHYTGKIALVIVLRSGLAMSDAFLGQLAPDRDVVVYHIGMFRERATLTPVEYYNKLPSNNTDVKRAYVLDPLIATGGTGSAVISILRDWGIEHITFVSILSSAAGLQNISKVWPEGTDFVVGSVDPSLDDEGYIVPGIGDIGDRLFGTSHSLIN